MKRWLTTSLPHDTRRYALRGVASLFLVVLFSSCLKTSPVDPQLALTLTQQAEDLFRIQDYSGAATTMAAAVAADPANLPLSLRLGELYEFTDRPDKALAVYAVISMDIGTAASLRDEASYRAALLLLLKLDRPGEAGTFLDRLPAKSPRRGDGEGVRMLVSGDPRRALILFNELSQHPLEQSVGARVAYHAALCFGRLNSLPEAFAALYQAINLAGTSIIARDIERYNDELKKRESAI